VATLPRLTKQQRSEIAQAAVQARWAKARKPMNGKPNGRPEVKPGKGLVEGIVVREL
jgi:hypothetical protein